MMPFLYGNTSPAVTGVEDLAGINTEELFTTAAAGTPDYAHVWRNFFNLEGKIADQTEQAPNLLVLRPSTWLDTVEGIVNLNNNMAVPMSSLANGFESAWMGMEVVQDKNVKANTASTVVGFMLSNFPQNIVVRMKGGYRTAQTRDSNDERRGQTTLTISAEACLQVRFIESLGVLRFGATARTP